MSSDKKDTELLDTKETIANNKANFLINNT